MEILIHGDMMQSQMEDFRMRYVGQENLQKKLGTEYTIIEEGLCGRTAVFEDPLNEGLNGTPISVSMFDVSWTD